MSKLTFSGKRLKKIFKWDSFTPMEHWFEKNIRLIKGNTRGAFRVKTAPHLREIFQELDKNSIQVVTLKSASQVQKTTAGLGAILKWLDTDYHDLFIMIPRANDIKKFLEFKIKPAIEGCESVKRKTEDYNQDEKERKNSYFYKTAQNLLAVISSNDTKSITTKYMLFDEAAEFEGGKIEEAIERAKTYGYSGFKAMIVSTMVHKNDSVNHFYDTAEVKKQYFMYCHHCNGHYYPMREHIKFATIDEYKAKYGIDKETTLSYNEIQADYKPYAAETAVLECPLCNGITSDTQRRDNILRDKLKWFQVVATQKDEYSEIIYDISAKPKTQYRTVGFDINTLCSSTVPLRTFAEKEIECTYAPPHMQDVLWEKYYIGYLNKFYTKSEKANVKKNDILKLSNGLQNKVVPKATNALHLGVDLQKNRLYYVLAAVQHNMVIHRIDSGELFNEGLDNDFMRLRQIIEAEYYDEDGITYRIKSATIDLRGFGGDTPTGELMSRRLQVWRFIEEYIKYLDDFGVLGAEDFIFPSIGFPDLKNEEAYKLSIRSFSAVDEEGNSERRKLKALDFSNIRIKSMLFNMLERSVAKANAQIGDGAYNYDRNLIYVNDDVIQDAEARANLPYDQRHDKNSFENHLTSEHLTYKIGKNGKIADKMTYEKRYESVRNDYLDCLVAIIVQILHFRTDQMEQKETISETDFINSIASSFS